MEAITVNKLTEQELKDKGILSWPIWEKEASTFPWEYSSSEECYILEGNVTVTPDDGRKAVSFGPGDFVVFPMGMSCTWQIHKAVKKHYKFG